MGRVRAETSGSYVKHGDALVFKLDRRMSEGWPWECTVNCGHNDVAASPIQAINAWWEHIHEAHGGTDEWQ